MFTIMHLLHIISIENYHYYCDENVKLQIFFAPVA